MKPGDLASRSQQKRDLRRLDSDGFVRKTFTLPVNDARAQRASFSGDIQLPAT